MKVIIAEKPSVARSIAAIVGATDNNEGYIEGNGNAVTWVVGHLVGLAMPETDQVIVILSVIRDLYQQRPVFPTQCGRFL